MTRRHDPNASDNRLPELRVVQVDRADVPLPELPPRSFEIECSGSRHTLTWEPGRLAAPNHDVERERTFGHLGSRVPRCMELMRAWSEADLSEAIAMAGKPGAEPHHRRHAFRQNLTNNRRMLAGGVRNSDLPDAELLTETLERGILWYSTHVVIWDLDEDLRLRWCSDALRHLPSFADRELKSPLRSAIKWRLRTLVQSLGGPAELIRGLEVELLAPDEQPRISQNRSKSTLHIAGQWLRRALVPAASATELGIVLGAGSKSSWVLSWSAATKG